jgi:hypothetical protein
LIGGQGELGESGRRDRLFSLEDSVLVTAIFQYANRHGGFRQVNDPIFRNVKGCILNPFSNPSIPNFNAQNPIAHTKRTIFSIAPPNLNVTTPCRRAHLRISEEV